MYKGTNINSIITTGATNVPTTAYKGFPAYNPSAQPYDKISSDLLYQISSSDITSTSNIQAVSYKSVNTNGSYPIPSWCNGIKFYISSAKGTAGSKGATGSKGDQGDQGDQGDNDQAKN